MGRAWVVVEKILLDLWFYLVRAVLSVIISDYLRFYRQCWPTITWAESVI